MGCKTLIIEDQDKVASTIEHQLLQLGKFDVHICRNVDQALERISGSSKQPFDLLLCDYHLGSGTNGQQLLEYLRHERKIPRRTGFIMVTAEGSYGAVASSVELAPDAYLLKPFTQDALSERVAFTVAKRDALSNAYLALDKPSPDLQAAMAACKEIILAGGRFAIEALKLKAECLLQMQEWAEAASVYDKIIAWRPTPWAEVGLARALRRSGNPEIALDKLRNTLASFPQYVAAYDEVAALAEERGELDMAISLLEKAHHIVPSNRRSRKLGLLNLEVGDYDKATRYLKVVTEKDRYGLMRSTEDFFGLAAAYRQQERFGAALETLDGIPKHFPESRPLTVRIMAAQATTLRDAKRPHEARQKVHDALELLLPRMEPRTQLELAAACHQCSEQERALELFQHVAENWQEDSQVVAKVMDAMDRVGIPEDDQERIKRCIRELVELNNRAGTLLQQGAFGEVVEIMEGVAKRLPNNVTVQANYVHALLSWLDQNSPPNMMDLPLHSKPRMYVAAAREHLRRISQLEPENHRLPGLQQHFSRITAQGGRHEAVGAAGMDDLEPASMTVGQ